jgi:hypothetical protein
LFHELLVTKGIEDLTLQRDAADHDTVQNLDDEVFFVELKALVLGIGSGCLAKKTLVIEGTHNLRLRIIVDLSKTNNL